MGRRVHRACEQCAQKCALFHGKGKSSSHSPSSFFKVMVGDDFSRVLYFPPKFSSTVSAFVNKKMTLKDSSGQRWTATVTTVDNSFALEGGWNAFASDHGLEIGDFLLFNYICDLQLDVIIYGRSCCERLDFSKRKNNKRRRDRSGSPVRDVMLVKRGPNASVIPEPDVLEMNGQSREVDIGRTQNISKSDKSNGGAQSMGIMENSEDPCHMTSQDYCGVDETQKISTGNSKVSHVDHASCVYQNDATRCNKYPLFEATMGSGAALDASKVELSGKTLGDTDRSACDKTSTSKLEENRGNNCIMSNREVQERQFAEDLESDHVVTSKEKQNTKQMFNSIPNVSGEMPNTMKECVDRSLNGSLKDKLSAEGVMPETMKKERVDRAPNGSSLKNKSNAEGVMSKRIQKEHMDMTPDLLSPKYELGGTGLSKFIKHEFDQNSLSLAAVSCVVPSDNDDFLELPTRLPYSYRGRVKMDRMVVLLRDPQRQLWPVLYHEQPGLKVLTAGWSRFCRVSNIQPADVCIFGLEDDSRHIYSVDIVRNQ